MGIFRQQELSAQYRLGHENLNATDPKQLVFAELPRALGVDLKKKEAAARFGKTLTNK